MLTSTNASAWLIPSAQAGWRSWQPGVAALAKDSPARPAPSAADLWPGVESLQPLACPALPGSGLASSQALRELEEAAGVRI